MLSKLVVMGFTAVALAACDGTTPAPESQESAPASAPVTAEQVTATVAVEPTQQNMLGSYVGTLPCGDCKGVNTKLELLGDGTYTLSEVYDGKVGDGSVLDSTGRWSADFASRRLTLDPAAQAWEDRYFEVLSAGHIRPLDATGKAYSIDGTNDLRVGN
ncbi:copper resistance protein NlpE [Pseudoxanthomonas sp. LjRoot143]